MTDAEEFFTEIEKRREAARDRAKEDQRQIGQRTRTARGDLSQAYVVNALEQGGELVLSTRALSEIESGKRALKMSEAVILAELYGVELVELTPDGGTSREAALRQGAGELVKLHNYIEERLIVISGEVE